MNYNTIKKIRRDYTVFRFFVYVDSRSEVHKFYIVSGPLGDRNVSVHLQE